MYTCIKVAGPSKDGWPHSRKFQKESVFLENHQVASVGFHTKTQTGRYIKENNLKNQAVTNYKIAIFSKPEVNQGFRIDLALND